MRRRTVRLCVRSGVIGALSQVAVRGVLIRLTFAGSVCLAALVRVALVVLVVPS